MRTKFVDTNAKIWIGREAAARRLAYQALLAIVEAPERQASHSFGALIPWDTVNAIRAELEAAGFPWRQAVRLRVQAEQEAKAARRAERQAREDAAKAAKGGNNG